MIDPNKAITMVENKGSRLLVEGENIQLLRIPDGKQANRINTFAFNQQCTTGEGWIISPKREALEYQQKKKENCVNYENRNNNTV